MIILLNGPPRCGKDTAAKLLHKLIGSRGMKMSWPLKTGLQHTFGLTVSEAQNFEKQKDVPSVLFNGLSYREAQIALFKHLAATYGDEVLAQIFYRRIVGTGMGQHVVVSDCGKTVEAHALIRMFGAKNVGLIQLTREGCTFENDTREYVDVEPFTFYDKIDNKYELEFYQAQLERTMKKWNLLS